MKFFKINNSQIAVLSALFAAGLYAVCIPCAKIIGFHVPSTMLGAFLYLGAGFGLLMTSFTVKK